MATGSHNCNLAAYSDLRSSARASIDVGDLQQALGDSVDNRVVHVTVHRWQVVARCFVGREVKRVITLMLGLDECLARILGAIRTSITINVIGFSIRVGNDQFRARLVAVRRVKAVDTKQLALVVIVAALGIPFVIENSTVFMPDAFPHIVGIDVARLPPAATR